MRDVPRLGNLISTAPPRTAIGRDTRYGAHESLWPRCRCDSNCRRRYSDFQLDRVLQHQLATKTSGRDSSPRSTCPSNCLNRRLPGSTFVAIGVWYARLSDAARQAPSGFSWKKLEVYQRQLHINCASMGVSTRL